MSTPNLSTLKKIHIVGIKGSGVVALAQILQSRGVVITGSDGPEKFFTDEVLKKLGIPYNEKFAAENIPQDVDAVLYSTAYKAENNVEVAEAKKRGLELISYPEILAALFNEKYGIAVCGSHGKTTTSALLAHTLLVSGLDPTAVIGGRVTDWGSNARVGQSEYFVIEADEYQNKLQYYHPKAAILTSVDWDHPDFYKTVESYDQAFIDFVSKMPEDGILVACGDDAGVRKILSHAKCRVITYGFSPHNECKIISYSHSKTGAEVEFEYQDKVSGKINPGLRGRHNALNNAAVFALGRDLGGAEDKIKEGIETFKGTSRRFELIGERNGAVIIDDYGHHPTEVAATIASAREQYPERKMIVAFHPHSFSRTEALLDDFAKVLSVADEVLILEIYGSAREQSGNITSAHLVEAINRIVPGKAALTPKIEDAILNLKNKISEKDIVLCIGAGNVFEVAHVLVKI